MAAVIGARRRHYNTRRAAGGVFQTQSVAIWFAGKLLLSLSSFSRNLLPSSSSYYATISYIPLQHLLTERCHHKCDSSLIQRDVVLSVWGASVPHPQDPELPVRELPFSRSFFLLPFPWLLRSWQKTQRGCKLHTSAKRDGHVCAVKLLALCGFETLRHGR